MIDMNNLFKTIIQPNIKFLGLVIVILILAGQYLETNVIYMISIVLFIFVNYKSILGTFRFLDHSPILITCLPFFTFVFSLIFA